MPIKIKEKLNQMWDWTKDKVKRFWKWLLIGGATITIAATILPPEQIPDDLLLKVNKTQILESKEVDWIEVKPDGDIINKGRIIKYDYISDKIVGQAAYQGLTENILKRTGNAQFFKKRDIFVKGEKVEEEWVGKFYGGTPFWKVNDKWYQTETATTTIEAFNKQISATFFDKLLGQDAYALSSTSYSGVGDGYVRNRTDPWATAHDASDGNLVDYTGVDPSTNARLTPTPDYQINRSFWPFYTAGIPANASISTTTFYNYIVDTTDTTGGVNGFVTVVQTDQPDHTILTTADFNNAGATTTPTEGVDAGDRLDLTGLPAGIWITWSLNATGRSWIKVSGAASTCGASLTGWTCLGLRIGFDTNNVAPTGNGANMIVSTSSEGAGITNDPYLTIGYTIPSTAGIISSQLIIFE